MKMHLGGKVLAEAEIVTILEQAFTILERVGIEIGNVKMLEILEAAGGKVNDQKTKILFERNYVVDFLKNSEKIDWNDKKVLFSATAEIYHGQYLDPRDNTYKPWTQERLNEYIALAQRLPNIDQTLMLGCPVENIPVKLQPLYEKLFCWKYGINGGMAIWETGLCSKIYEMFQAYASELGKSINEIFNCEVYLISPLKFSAVEAEQFMYFYERGLATGVGTLGSLGGTVPVTASGALSVHLAEHIFINILERIFFGKKGLSFKNSLSAVDMSSGSFQYGRPEQVLLNVAGAQIAEYLGASYVGHGGLSDAKVPGNESAAQKIISAVFNGITSGNGHISAGLLSVDEVFSPIQMILDNEAVGALRHIVRGIEVNEDTLAMETIQEVGTGGNFLGTDHTAEFFRESLWWPAIWSNCMFSKWSESGQKNDVDYAKEIFFDTVRNTEPLHSQISPKLEQELLQIIKK